MKGYKKQVQCSDASSLCDLQTDASKVNGMNKALNVVKKWTRKDEY